MGKTSLFSPIFVVILSLISADSGFAGILDCLARLKRDRFGQSGHLVWSKTEAIDLKDLKPGTVIDIDTDERVILGAEYITTWNRKVIFRVGGDKSLWVDQEVLETLSATRAKNSQRVPLNPKAIELLEDEKSAIRSVSQIQFAGTVRDYSKNPIGTVTYDVQFRGGLVSGRDVDTFVRRAGDPPDPQYLSNALASLEEFTKYLAKENPTPRDLQEALSSSHSVAAVGADGARPYRTLRYSTDKIRPGQVRTNTRGYINEHGLDAAKKALKQAGLPESELIRGHGDIPGVIASAQPVHIDFAHHYPDPVHFPVYFQRMFASLGKAKTTVGEGALDSIAEYYYVAVNARQFGSINNSLFMNQVNYLLKSKGLTAIPHGDLDYVAHAVKFEAFKKIFRQEVLQAK